MKIEGKKIPYPMGEKSFDKEYREKLLEDEELDKTQGGELDFKIYKEGFKPRVREIERQKIGTTVLKKIIRDAQSTELQPLQTMGSNVVGNLFDRVRFLRERIEETKVAIKEREEMNKRFNEEIDSDIKEMEKIIAGISNRDELREFKLNVTLLRMEKRKENTLFWRDIVALKNQLKELNEQHEVESKISSMFSDLNTS